jgi:hypothetical protein
VTGTGWVLEEGQGAGKPRYFHSSRPATQTSWAEGLGGKVYLLCKAKEAFKRIYNNLHAKEDTPAQPEALSLPSRPECSTPASSRSLVEEKVHSLWNRRRSSRLKRCNGLTSLRRREALTNVKGGSFVVTSSQGGYPPWRETVWHSASCVPSERLFSCAGKSRHPSVSLLTFLTLF